MPDPRGTDGDGVTPAARDPLADLLLQSAGGDQAAFAELYDSVASRVHGITLRIVVDPDLAEVVTQEVFVEVWRRAATFDPSSGSARGWITTIAHRRAVERARSAETACRRDAAWHEDAEKTRPVADLSQAHVNTLSILTALAQLPTPHRRAIELAYFGGHTHAEISTLLAVAPGSTGTLITHALASFREGLST